jgi:hypothetical protein
MNVLFNIDHYDAYTYLIIGPISFFASLLFIILNIYFKEARRFPGNILIIISIAELGLCVHWFASGLYSPSVLGVVVDEKSMFCRVNSYFAVTLASVEFYYHLAFLISIIIMFRNTMKEIKFKGLFNVVPMLLVIASVWIAVSRDSLGKNIYGTCSMNQLKHGVKLYSLAIGVYMLAGGYALIILRRFIRMTKREITRKDDFYSFYFNYTILIFILYTLVGLMFIVGTQILECDMTGTDDEKTVCYKWFYFSRICNNVKVFIPLWAFLLRIKDPFLRKLIQRFLRKESEKESTVNSFEEEIVIIDNDFLINNQIKEIRKGMIRTILLGLSEYYGSLIFYYQKIDDEQLINNLRQPIGKNVKSTRNLPDYVDFNSTERIYDCGMNCFGSKQFKKIIDSRDFGNIDPSFSPIKNKDAINKIGEMDGGSGGEFFLMTHDKRFIIKTITEDEEAIFKNILVNYCDYIATSNGSFICRILGLFTFDFNITSQKIKLVVMENIFKKHSIMIDRRYDLKGSLYKRQALKKTFIDLEADKHAKINCTLKDVDFANLDDKIELEPEDRLRIVSSLTNDANFFMRNRIIDYSLLMGLIETSRLVPEQIAYFNELAKTQQVYFSKDRKLILIIGIIDYFQLYTFAKFFEKWSKKLINLNCNLETSSQPAGYYARRFISFVNKILA